MKSTRRFLVISVLGLSCLLLGQLWAWAQTIGTGSCNPAFEDPCFLNSGDIGDNSCNGDEACFFNSGDIGDGSW